LKLLDHPIFILNTERSDPLATIYVKRPLRWWKAKG
jgi:hypothetical protein